MNITAAEILEALAHASRQTARPERTVTMEEIRSHTGWGEKVAYRRVKDLIRDGKVRVTTIHEPNLLGRIVPKAGYQLT